MKLIMEILFGVMYMYYMYQLGEIEKGSIKKLILFIIALTVIISSWILNMLWIGWVINTAVFMLFGLFYDKESFKYQWHKYFLPGIIISAAELSSSYILYVDYYLEAEVLCFVTFVVLAKKRGYLNLFNIFIVGMIYLIIMSGNIFFSVLGEKIFINTISINIFKIIFLVIAAFILVLLEGTLISYKTGFEKSTESFQNRVLSQQYDEIKNIYLNMRGWRHDYHNHLQVIKAQMALNDYEGVDSYLDDLERDLDSVDTFVKSGNMMIDAILNSKLSIAEKFYIKINCKAEVPEEINIEDVDLCVILGNILDNAMESCEKIDADKRFMRIYIIVNKKQLYISVQNSAKEILNFNEKNYITSKRGNHGLGMKRVQSVIDKYDGFLNLQNEPGIFATEVMIPLV